MLRLHLAFVLLTAACARSSTEPRQAAPPPPPPPRVASSQPVPPVIAEFVRAHEKDPGAWRVTLAERDNAKPHLLSSPDGAELLERLMDEHSYIDGEYGCVGQPLDIRLVRGDASLALAVDCGHLYLSPQGHAGPWVTLSPHMVELVDRLRVAP